MYKQWLLAAILALAICGCSLRHFALDQAGNALAEGGAAFAADDDPELIRDAAPFSLKLIESLLAQRPRHEGLLLAGARGFTQYAYAFIQQDAEEIEAKDVARATQLEDRARRLYLRARDYGLRAFALRRPQFVMALRRAPREALTQTGGKDVALLYWTGVAWGALIALSKDKPERLAELPIVEAMMDRALELHESFERGAIHAFFVGYEPVRQGVAGDPYERARKHFARAVELSAGKEAAPYVALAESVCIPQQRRAEFQGLLRQALAIDVEAPSETRLANLVAQRRARWLLSRIDHLFAD